MAKNSFETPQTAANAGSAMDSVVVRGAREHNLRGVDLAFPRDSLTTFTGVSGSGKSSLAYHTIYQEGQRRFLESLSSYARQFIGRMEKPKVDLVEGLSPTVSIDQRSTSHSPRSTVGTLTEISDFLRLMWSRLGEPSCPECGASIEAWSPDQVTDAILAGHAGEKAMVLAPVVRERKGEYRKELADWAQRGFVRARIDGEVRRLDEDIALERYVYHTIELVIDRLTLKPQVRSRLAEAVEQAVQLGSGLVALSHGEDGYRLFSTLRSCPNGHGALPEMEPRLFSFNSPIGACPTCEGLGEIFGFSPDLIVRDATKSLREGALYAFNDQGKLVYGTLTIDHLAAVGKAFGFDVDTPWQKLSKKAKKIVLYGSGKKTFEFRWQRKSSMMSRSGSDRIAFPGIMGHFERVYRPSRARNLDRFRASVQCSDCEGARLCAAARAVMFDGRSLPELMALSIEDATVWVQGLSLTGTAEQIGRPIQKEIERRLLFLCEVGLGYLTLARRAPTLSGGEAQRIRLAAQVGAGLRGILYVLDEPSIGLHARDQQRLLRTLEALRDRGNTVVVVEHDEETMRRSDFLVDVGPQAGIHGGEIVVAGSPEEVERDPRSLTGSYLRGDLEVPMPTSRRVEDHGVLQIRAAHHHNLKGLDVAIPLGRLNAITGVSGSGKSTLVHHVLVPWLRRSLMRADAGPSHCKSIEGVDQLDKVVEIDQRPIGRTPRSNPATYTGIWTLVRDLFAMLPESRLRQYEKGRFSFNVAGGRCEACGGAGLTTLDMNFLAPVEVVCEECGGARFNADTLAIRWKDKSVQDVLAMTVDEAAEFFAEQPKIARGLVALQDVGLGYIHLGQPSTTLSGGEAQRVKLATELQRPATGSTFYVLDEPTTGLHFHDVTKLLDAMQRLVDAGNTVLVIEHNLDVVRAADWIIDLGPEGGAGGGQIVAEGTPEEVAADKHSHTGAALRAIGIGKGQKRKGKRKALAAAKNGRPGPLRARKAKVIAVRGAKTHNLQNIDCDVPLGRFTVVTGPSGSGKSSLAFDTIFQEGQRRFLESMSTYARRFLGRLDRAPVESIDGLGPAIAIDQKRTSRSPRSTVATTTEIHDYLRLLFARVGRPHCPDHGHELVAWSPTKAAKKLVAELEGKRAFVLAPIQLPADLRGADTAEAKKRARSWLSALLTEWRKLGYVRVLVDGQERRIDDGKLSASPRELLLVIDRLTIGDRGRLSDSIEQAQEAAAAHGGTAAAIVQLAGSKGSWGARHWFRVEQACEECGFQTPTDPHPRWFSFNHHSGACSACLGLGEVVLCAEELLVNHPDKPTFAGAIKHRGAAFTFLTNAEGWYAEVASQVAKQQGFDLSKPWKKLSKKARHTLLRGSGDVRYEVVFRKHETGRKREWRMSVAWKGLARQVEEWFHGKEGGEHSGDERYREVMRSQSCPECSGERLMPGPRHVRVGGVRLPELLAATVDAAHERIVGLRLTVKERRIAADVLKELGHRMSFLRDTGLGYLTLDRSASTLSGGEAQRIRLATQLGNKLVGVLYVLDEPTVGLHPRDTERLLRTLLELRDLGNTVVAVEHDEMMVRAADHILDLGPGGGHRGGHIVAAGTPAVVARSSGLTGQWLRGDIALVAPKERRKPRGYAALRNISVHNIVDLDIDVPLGCFTTVTGVSGSGKSSLIMNALVPALKAQQQIVTFDTDDDEELRYQLVVVDQGPIGSSPSSNPATYTGVFTHIRELFSRTNMARQKGFTPGRFSFHVAAGRCSHCEGKGQIQVEMHFLADVWVQCEVCGARRYNSETLSVDYRGKNIADVLDMEIDGALAFFGNHPKIARPLQLLHDVGLGYLQLGQPANTFSGGEAQRIKLCTELATRPRSHMIYVLDEPTTGLHLDDIKKLVAVLDRLLERGDSVLVIEHHLDLIMASDQVIELGPEAGEHGGQIVAQGTPEEVARVRSSHTGQFLAKRLASGRKSRSGALKASAKKRSAKRATVRKAGGRKPGARKGRIEEDA